MAEESRLGMTYAEQFAARYAAGATVREIANEARLSHNYILRHLRNGRADAAGGQAV